MEYCVSLMSCCILSPASSRVPSMSSASRAPSSISPYWSINLNITIACQYSMSSASRAPSSIFPYWSINLNITITCQFPEDQKQTEWRSNKVKASLPKNTTNYHVCLLADRCWNCVSVRVHTTVLSFTIYQTALIIGSTGKIYYLSCVSL
jgi:hypothetical protein